MKSFWRLINCSASHSESREVVAEDVAQDIGEAKCSETSRQTIGDFDSKTIASMKCDENVKVEVNNRKNKIDKDDFLSLDPKRVARDLVMEDWYTYKQLTLEEVRKYEKESCLIINQLLQNHDKVYQWTIETVLGSESIKNQRKNITKFILIAQALVCNNDFHSSHAIISALQSSSINGLEGTWKKLTSNKLEMYKNLTALFSEEKNYFKLTEKMDDANYVNNICIPYLALFIKDFYEKVSLDQDDKLDTLRRVGVVVDDLRKLVKFRHESTSTTFLRSRLIHDGIKYRWI